MYSVIVVDGDKETVELLKNRIEWKRLGCRLAGTALNLEEGLFLMQREKPDLVITDVLPGGKEKMDFLRIIYERKTEKQPAVIILSACREFEEACRAIQYEAALYLTKPPSVREMENGIQWVLKRLKREKQQMIRLAEKLHCENGRLKGEEERNQNSRKQALQEKKGTETDRTVSLPSLSQLKRIRSEAGYYSPFVREALSYIDSHLEQELSLTVLCEELSLSHSYFSKKFKRETGIGYVAYVTMAKMERAGKLMENPRNRANEVAKQLGYYDYSYFFQNFRRYFGCSPREFKSQGRSPE